jgi:hypothetical protein
LIAPTDAACTASGINAVALGTLLPYLIIAPPFNGTAFGTTGYNTSQYSSGPFHTLQSAPYLGTTLNLAGVPAQYVGVNATQVISIVPNPNGGFAVTTGVPNSFFPINTTLQDTAVAQALGATAYVEVIYSGVPSVPSLSTVGTVMALPSTLTPPYPTSYGFIQLILSEPAAAPFLAPINNLTALSVLAPDDNLCKRALSSGRAGC